MSCKNETVYNTWNCKVIHLLIIIVSYFVNAILYIFVMLKSAHHEDFQNKYLLPIWRALKDWWLRCCFSFWWGSAWRVRFSMLSLMSVISSGILFRLWLWDERVSVTIFGLTFRIPNHFFIHCVSVILRRANWKIQR